MFDKARPVPHVVKPMVDQEFDRQVHTGILKKVPYSEWWSPVVVVCKADRTVRLFGDYKVSLNPAMEVDKYPLPNLEDMLASFTDNHFSQNWICLLPTYNWKYLLSQSHS